MELKDGVSAIASVLTIFLFLSGSLICLKIIRLGHTGSHPSLTFVAGIFSTGSWLIYSILLDDHTMIFTNCFGLVVQILYLMVFLLYCVSVTAKQTVRRQIICLLAAMGTISYYAVLSNVDFETVKFHMGVLSCAGSIAFCASPLSSLVEVVKTKSTSILPFPLITLMFLSASMWTLYGRLIDVVFVIIPNFLCAVISGVQLLLFLVYPSIPVETKVVVAAKEPTQII